MIRISLFVEFLIIDNFACKMLRLCHFCSTTVLKDAPCGILAPQFGHSCRGPEDLSCFHALDFANASLITVRLLIFGIFLIISVFIKISTSQFCILFFLHNPLWTLRLIFNLATPDTSFAFWDTSFPADTNDSFPSHQK